MRTIIRHQRQGVGGLIFRNPVAFYAGCAAVTLGVLLHLPAFIAAREMHYRLAGMPMDSTMLAGMALTGAGLILAAWGVSPPPRPDSAAYRTGTSLLRALDDAPLSARHWRLVVVLAVALIIDVMKPATLAFVVPGMQAEYGLSKTAIALPPFVALTGTALGSVVWGWLGDRIGRRASLLLAAIIFVGTSICGAMPVYGWNVVMCFLMGASAGGLLPITITLLSEVLPVRHRAALVVLLVGIGATGGYLVTSASAALLEPTFGWRIMWFLGLPTGLLLLLLNRAIPESPRFLLSQGRVVEGDQILLVFGAVREGPGDGPSTASGAVPQPGVMSLVRCPYRSQSLAIALYGVAWGLVNYGFFLWLPLNLRQAGFGVEASDAILAKSAFMAVPGVLLVTWLYARWSSRNSLVLFSLLTALSLLAFVPLAANGAHKHVLVLTILVVALLVTSTGMSSALAPYSAEVYPTEVRARGAGLAAGSGKFGGMIGLGAVLAHLAPVLAVSAPLVAAPVALSSLVLGVKGIETRGRRLEDTSALAAEPVGSALLPRSE